MKIILLCICLLSMLSLQSQNKKIPSVIFDTDMGPDYDDVGAITLLHAFADSEKLRYWQQLQVQNTKALLLY